jgi:hypothetical protein
MRNAKMLLICLLFFSAQSQTPSPTPTKAGQPKESHGPTKKGETDTDKTLPSRWSPLSINAAP